MESREFTRKNIIIAIDVDDVLARFVQRLLEFHNAEFHTSLQFSDFHSYHFMDVWGGTLEECMYSYYEENLKTRSILTGMYRFSPSGLTLALVKMRLFFESEYFKTLPVIEEAYETLSELRATGNFEFHIVTSRQTVLSSVTEAWIHDHFPGIFSGFMYGNSYGEGIRRQKGEMCKEIGAVAIVDDNIIHIENSAQSGIKGILLNLHGSYMWSRKTHLPENCVLVHNWMEIKEELLKLVSCEEMKVNNCQIFD